jgi:hypothetical protein
MWIFLSKSFLSIVAHPSRAHMLVVRARVAGDITAVFPRAKEHRTPERDYLFRAFIPRKVVAEAMAREVEGLRHTNFKASVLDQERHDVYLGVWGVMNRWQERRERPPARIEEPDLFDTWETYPVPEIEPDRRRGRGKGQADIRWPPKGWALPD